jgi:hypothetical protein
MGIDTSFETQRIINNVYDASTNTLSTNIGGSGSTITTTHGKTIKSAVVSVGSSGNNTLVSAVTSKRIKVIGYILQSLGTVNVQFRSNSTPLSGVFNFQTREGITQATAAPSFLFGTNAGEALVLNLSAGVNVVGIITYYDDDGT